MAHDIESFWTDIKRYEEILDRDPVSYCFAPLSELYRKVGLLDDAIATARKGIGLHPEYVGGYMALGRASFEKGDRTESLTALERVARVTPDNLLAQKLLSQLYIDSGETDKARRSLDIILSLNPDDLESKVALDALARSVERGFQPETDFFPDEDAASSVPSAILDEEDESLFEEAEIIEDLDEEVFNEEIEAAEPGPFAIPFPAEAFEEVHEQEPDPDPLSTATIADLYVSQGFLKKALRIYRDLSEANPNDEELRNRLVQLKLRIDEDEARARENALADTLLTEATADVGVDDNEDFASSADSAPTQNALAVLEGWLENIGRIRQCRSGRR